MRCLVTQSCLTLFTPADWSLPGSSVHGDSLGKNTGVGCYVILQGSSQPRDQTQVSHIASEFFTIWDMREAQKVTVIFNNISNTESGLFCCGLQNLTFYKNKTDLLTRIWGSTYKYRVVEYREKEKTSQN